MASQIGPIVIHWYGLLIVVGTLLGAVLASREAKRQGNDPEHVWRALLWGLLLGLLGARVYHVVSTPADGTGGLQSYLHNPLDIIQVWNGGLGIIGGIAGGVLGVVIYARRNGLNAWHWLDIGAPSLVLAQAIVRWANFVNQELYGPPTGLPWGIKIEAEHRIPRYADLTRFPIETTRFHPTFLYESLWNLGLFALLVWARRRWAHRLQDGDIFLAYLGFYGIGRVWIEQFFRPDAWRLENGLAVGALIFAWVALVAELMLLQRHRAPK
jgi:phosphatidylglycerol:prolipoprotein diacylglycerol transferase